MKTCFSFCLLFCFFLLTSCDKSDEIKPIDTYTTGYISFAVNNASKSFVHLPVRDCYPDAKVDNESYNIYRLIHGFPVLSLAREEKNQLVSQSTDGFIYITFGGIDIESMSLPYSVNSYLNVNSQYAQIALTRLKDKNNVRYTGFSRYEQQDVDVIITAIDKDERRIKGTFSGAVTNSETGEVLELKDGAFDVKYNQ